MTDIKRVGDSGVHTVEGNVAGDRAAQLTRERDQQRAEYESIKSKIKQQNASSFAKIDDKFNTGNDNLEQEFRKNTCGLVSAEEFRKYKAIAEQVPIKDKTSDKEDKEQQKIDLKRKQTEDKKKKMKAVLSFGDDGIVDDSDTVESQPLKKVAKNPLVDTSFLPDRERDLRKQEEVGRLTKDWLQEQEVVKNEMMAVVYSYWDGSGHRKAMEVKKGTKVGRFLELVKLQLLPEFHELRNTSPDSLIYVKEDLIIPHHLSFYDMIVTKARGKSGPLFHFDVRDDIRVVNDSRVEKEDSHPGKVVERRWYERNKHIFPASRWEVFDPSVRREEGYTIHGGELNHK